MSDPESASFDVEPVRVLEVGPANVGGSAALFAPRGDAEGADFDPPIVVETMDHDHSTESRYSRDVTRDTCLPAGPV